MEMWGLYIYRKLLLYANMYTNSLRMRKLNIEHEEIVVIFNYFFIDQFYLSDCELCKQVLATYY